MDTSREKAWSILTQHVQEKTLLNHCLAVEAAMRAYAAKYGEDVEYWGAVGLLHDVDFEKYPEEHPGNAGNMLKPHGYTDEFIIDIESHARDWEPERSLLQKVLLGVDELTGFIIACALVRPDKSIANLQVKSVMKKMKDKAFARAVNRETIIQGAQMLEVELQEHIEFVAAALAKDLSMA
ncbi:HDIG domain-containing metalloprotein [Pelosinus propionicus]|uniref:HDIG domain-containing protein n=1 Tax=Pelosinus propionicus DSM 13327 TaxID=1123291 RepID=A0A1I4KNF0_9FIRM|nr:HDIG domain-containing metalloprotein [Pelosinus propionicus]SFL80089.1 HDIG domain-containing protein [Pelosinus propionicus DSM 13327]